MTTFDDVRLPEDVEFGAHGGPAWQTTIVALSSGSEQRNQDWSRQRCKFDVGYGIQSIADFEDARDFHYGRRGRARGFRFKDWSDYQIPDANAVTHELIGVGTGAQTIFQIIKTYDDGSNHTYARKITRPVQGTLSVYVDGVLKTETTDYTVAYDTGVITFVAAPANTKEVRVVCEFDVPCRFDSDEFDLSIEGFQAGVVQSLLIIEIRE